MSVNEKLMAPGTFSVNLNLESTPNSVINSITPWGNIVLTPTRISPEEFTDAQIRDMARYVGIVQSQTISEEAIEVEGIGILAYLGDTDSRGMVLARDKGVGAVRHYVGDNLNDVIDRSGSTPYGILRDESAQQRAVRKGTITEVQYDDTVLLLNFEGSNGDTTTTDGSAFTSNQVITFSGTADISTDQAKYGNTSLHLVTDGFVTVADRPELDLTYQEFTVEWWEYRTSSSGNPTVWARNNDTYSPWIFGKAVSGSNRAYITHDGDGYGESEDLDMTMGTIDLNQWNHFAISHRGNQFRTFKNGVIQATVDKPELFIRVSSDSLQIGKGQNGNFFQGYLDGMAITRGNAKYWDAFTPSTSAPTATTANKTYTGSHYMESAYKTLKTICTTLDAEFKIQNDGTVDVGPPTSLFTGHGNSTPTGIIVRRLSGPDPEITGYSGIDLTTEFNAEDFVSRVELIASNYGAEINLGQADEKDVPYKDLHGNALERIQILSENDIPDSMRDIRAEAYLNEYNKIQKTLNVGLENYDVSGDIETGDVIYVYDPDVGFEDTTADATLENRSRHEVTYQGQILHPIKIRVMGLSFPIVDTMGVFYRDGDGNYTDLTDYVDFEVGTTQIEVGTTKKQINQDLRGSASVIAISGANELSVPDAPTGLAVAKGSYQDGSGRPFAFARLTWNEPTNTDGSRITDGNMYRVRYRQVTDVDGNNLIDSNDNQVTDYEYLTVEFGTQAVVIKGLGPNNTYEFGVACIDNSGFSGGFAVITASQMPNDSVAPPEPTPPTGTFGSVASSAALVQIQHKLGAAKTVAGATISSPSNFTLPRDIDHLNVYRGTTSNFSISATNFVGEIQARAGHIDGNITAIGSFQNTTQGTAYYKVTAVDVAGNESTASTAAQVTEQLIDTAFINDAAITTLKVGDAQITDAKIDTLTASKITAGTISGKEIIVDTDSATDPSNPVLGKIRSSNYQAGSQGWIINSDGSVEFSSGTFRGALSGATGTFSGSLSSGVSISAPTITGGTISGTSGTFTGDISGASGTFTGDLTGADITGGTINIGSGTFQVSNAGAVSASNLTITGGSLNYNSNTFGVTSSGVLTATSGTVGGNTLGSTFIESSNYNAGSDGWRINSDGTAEFESVEIRVAASNESSEDTVPSGSRQIKIGAVPIYDFNGNLNLHPASGKSIIIHNGNPFIIKGETGSAQMRFEGAGSIGDFLFDLDFVSYSTAQSDNTRRYSNPTPFTQIREFYFENDNTTIFRANEQNADVEFFGDIGMPSNSFIYINGDNGSNGDVLKRTATGMEWGTGSGAAHPDSDHSFDNYGSWTLKRGGSTVGNVSSGFGASWNASSGLSVSSSSNPFTITYSADFGTGNSQVARGDHSHTGTGISQINSPSVGLFSGYTFNTSGGQFSVSTIRSNDASYSFRNVFPTSGSASDLGHNFGNGRWRRLYTLNSPSVSSDERLKENIVDIPYGLDYINSLEPKQYNLKRVLVRGCNTCEMEIDEGVDECWNCTENGDTANIVDNLDVTGEKSGVINFGFTAQDLISTPPEPDVDIALVDYDEDSDEYGVRYNELIAPLVKAVQELSAKNDELESRLAALEG